MRRDIPGCEIPSARWISTPRRSPPVRKIRISRSSFSKEHQNIFLNGLLFTKFNYNKHLRKINGFILNGNMNGLYSARKRFRGHPVGGLPRNGRFRFLVLGFPKLG